MKKLIATAILFGFLCSAFTHVGFLFTAIARGETNYDQKAREALQAAPQCQCSTGGVCTCGTNCQCGERKLDAFPIGLDLVVGQVGRCVNGLCSTLPATTYSTLQPPQAASTVGFGCQGGSGGTFRGIGYYAQSTTTTYSGSGCYGSSRSSAGGCSGGRHTLVHNLSIHHQARVTDRQVRRGK